MKKFYKINAVLDMLIQADSQKKLYLSRSIIEDILKRNGYKFSKLQFDSLFGPLNANKDSEFSYK